MNNEITHGKVHGWLKNSHTWHRTNGNHRMATGSNHLPKVLVVTSYPPRECGIATYSQDLITALHEKFDQSFQMSICALETDNEKHVYQPPVEYVLNTDDAEDFIRIAERINQDVHLKIVLIQHEFGLLRKSYYFEHFLKLIDKPISIAFHTVLPNPNESLRIAVVTSVSLCDSVVVMTRTSAKILIEEYGIPASKLVVIPHGTHLVRHLDKNELKAKYKVAGRKTLTTFGLLSSGKSIETTLDSLPEIIRQEESVLFLIIGKTHPSVKKEEGEKYRTFLMNKVEQLNIQNHVQFVNQYVALPELLEYLQLTDVYLFTSKDRHQAVSGTFSYAISCGCPIISTPIPHAREVLQADAGIIVAFENPTQLSEAVLSLLADEGLLKEIGSNGLHRMAPTAWQNAAIAHARLFQQLSNGQIVLHYTVPPIVLDHLKKLTTNVGMIQFSKINQPDIQSGYTLDDNARALVAMCQHYEITREETDLPYIEIYLRFIASCLQNDGRFLNYVNEDRSFSKQNDETNLADSNGRAIWALGFLLSLQDILPTRFVSMASTSLNAALPMLSDIHSTRAMAFIIKGLYYRNSKSYVEQDVRLLTQLSNRLVQMYQHEAEPGWLWFESYLTYGNSILSEAMLCAWLATGNPVYKDVAKASFDFLLSKVFTERNIQVISNQGWLHKGKEEDRTAVGGEQPIDVTYTILALATFYHVFKEESYALKIDIAFDWFLGDNHLHQIMYNPSTGGCYDGLEETYVNLNQGAESTVSYLMARLTLEKARLASQQEKPKLQPTSAEPLVHLENTYLFDYQSNNE